MGTLMVKTNDFTFAETVGKCSFFQNKISQRYVPYGTAFGCEKQQFADATAMINLTGTSFAINDSFDHAGYKSSGRVKFSHKNQIVKLNGGGYCGWMAPKK